MHSAETQRSASGCTTQATDAPCSALTACYQTKTCLGRLSSILLTGVLLFYDSVFMAVVINHWPWRWQSRRLRRCTAPPRTGCLGWWRSVHPPPVPPSLQGWCYIRSRGRSPATITACYPTILFPMQTSSTIARAIAREIVNTYGKKWCTYHLRQTFPQRGQSLNQIKNPMIRLVTESGNQVQTKFIRPWLQIWTCDPMNVERFYHRDTHPLSCVGGLQ